MVVTLKILQEIIERKNKLILLQLQQYSIHKARCWPAGTSSRASKQTTELKSDFAESPQNTVAGSHSCVFFTLDVFAETRTSLL